MTSLIETTRIAPNFGLLDFKQCHHTRSNLMKGQRLLLGFSLDVYNLSTLRHLRWLQRNVYKLSLRQIKMAFIVPNVVSELSILHMSGIVQFRYPILADPEREVYRAYGVTTPKVFLIDKDRQIIDDWTLVDEYPFVEDITRAADQADV